jgi:hypothetical protein
VKASTVKFVPVFDVCVRRNHTIVKKLAELGTWPKGCQNDENHWPEASDAIFVHFKELAAPVWEHAGHRAVALVSIVV